MSLLHLLQEGNAKAKEDGQAHVVIPRRSRWKLHVEKAKKPPTVNPWPQPLPVTTKSYYSCRAPIHSVWGALLHAFGCENLQKGRFRYFWVNLEPQARRVLDLSCLEFGFRALGLYSESHQVGTWVRMISAGIPYTLPEGPEENDVPTFWLGLGLCV